MVPTESQQAPSINWNPASELHEQALSPPPFAATEWRHTRFAADETVAQVLDTCRRIECKVEEMSRRQERLLGSHARSPRCTYLNL
jgi:hypothetical protein